MGYIGQYTLLKWFVVAGGVLLSIVAYTMLQSIEHKKVEQEFGVLLDKYKLSIEYELEDSEKIFNALAAYHYGSEFVSKDEFHTFTKTIMPHHEAIQAIEWIPYVPYETYRTFEKEASSNLGREFFIRELNEEGWLVPVKKRDAYYPVYYVEPLNGNERAHGFDLGSEPIRREALLAAKESAEVRMTAPIRLVQEQGTSAAYLLYYPIYEGARFSGFYLGVYRADNTVQRAIQRITSECEGINLKIFDKNAAPDKSVLYAQPCEHKAAVAEGIVYRDEILFAGRTWVIEARPTMVFAKRHMTWHPYRAVLVIMLLSALIAFVIYLIERRNAVLYAANEELRRFQKVAVGREKRIKELRERLRELEAEKEGGHDVS